MVIYYSLLCIVVVTCTQVVQAMVNEPHKVTSAQHVSDRATATEYLHNSPSACYALAMHYLHADKKDRVGDIVYWLQVAANQGYALAQLQLAIWYEHGSYITRNHAEAQRLLNLVKAD